MKKLLVLDAKNYDKNYSEIYRESIRGIIFIDGKIVLVKSCYGTYNIPGGGVENQESDEETLVREILEETGYQIIKETIKFFGTIEEKRLSKKEPMIWHQINRYYTCEVDPYKGKCHYTANEIRHELRCVLMDIDEAIENNNEVIKKENKLPQYQRECRDLVLIKTNLVKNKA